MPLSHVSLTVADRSRSAAFYADHFGFATTVADLDGYRVELYGY